MDDGYVRAVMRFFVHLYGKGWIYRANRIINWCPYHQTSLSDLELVHVEVDDALDVRALPVRGRPGRRPDDRDRAARDDPGRRRRRGAPRATSATASWSAARSSCRSSSAAVPVIADERVDPEFGTGALKVTPGHDPLDFEIGRDHGLPELTVIGPDGRMNEDGRRARRADPGGGRASGSSPGCEERGLLEKREPYRHSVALCERCESRIEPLISLQWWCRMDELKQPGARGAARRARPLPPGVAAPLRDRLARERARLEHLAPDLVGPPAPGLVLPGRPRRPSRRPSRRRAPSAARPSCARDRTCSTPGSRRRSGRSRRSAGRSETPELERFYPGDLNTTAREIIRLWENRMIFAGLELMGEIPFRDVIIHSTVLAADGRRMSKSLGTGHRPARADRPSTAPTRPATGC